MTPARNTTSSTLRALIVNCREEKDINKKIEVLQRVNAMLPISKRLKLPSLFTTDYIHRALDTIEETLVAGPVRHTVSSAS